MLDALGSDAAVTLIAALATIAVFGGLAGERRVFALVQHLFAGLVTGYLAVLAVGEVLVPRIIEPMLANPAGRPDAWLLLALAASAAAAPWLPRVIAAVPVSLLVGSIAAFALGGALIGTALPQASAAMVGPGSPGSVAGGLLALAITVLVVLALLHTRPAAGVARGAVVAGRWILIGGLGGWLGFLLASRLTLLVDRMTFLLVDWLGIGR
jgi:hypothetical protein